MLRFLTGRNYRYSTLQDGGGDKSRYCTLAFFLRTLVILTLVITSFVAGRLSLRTNLSTTLNCRIAFSV